jgi:hypothetical protein
VTTNFDRGVQYLQPAIGKAPYWWWSPGLDTVPDGPGAYAINRPVPPIRQVIDNGLFCAAVVNLIRRANRKVVPTFGDYRYDGGTRAIQLYWSRFLVPFDRWTVYPRGTLIGRYFSWERLNHGDQGHVAVLLGEQDLAHQRDPLILHSHPEVGGLARTRLGASHAGWYYEYACLPWDWINHPHSGF